jgi:hypothetical protein
MNQMKRIAIGVICCLVYAGGDLIAQQVQYSRYQKFDFRGGDFSVVGKIGGRVYTYRGSSEGNYIDAYDDSMNLKATVVLDFFPSKIYETRFVAYNDQIIVLYQAVEGNKLILYAALLDATGRLKKGPIMLDNVKTGLFGPTRKYFSYTVSDDKKTIVVYSTRARGTELEFDGRWIDDQLNVIKRSTVSYKADNDIDNSDAIVADNGDLYLPAYTPVGTKAYSDQMWLLELKGDSKVFKANEFPLKDIYAASFYMKMDNVKNRIYVGGFYSDKKNGGYKGVLYAYYDIAADSLMNRKIIPFDEKLVNETGANNKKHAFDNYVVRQMIIKNDGGFVMVSEYYYVDTRNTYMPGFGYYSFYYSPYSNHIVREYYYDDILALSYDADGNREWDAFVYKDQYSIEDGGLFSSYILINTGGGLGFLYNDFDQKNSRIQIAIIDPDGKVATRAFAPEGKNVPDWMPRSGKQVSAREVVLPCLSRKQICFAKVSL